MNSRLDKVDPELKASLDAFPGFDISAESLPIIRQFPANPPFETPGYEEVFIASRDKETPLRCLIIDPKPNDESRPGLIYFHGGGFVFGSPEITLPTAQKLAEDIGCLIILPDYRLAPEHPFPAALEDGLSVLSWLDANADELRLDKTRVAIGGDSAGGGHAVVLTAAIRDRAGIKPSSLFLVYPMLDNETGAGEEGGPSIWTFANNRFGWNAYLGEGDIDERIADGAVPSKIEMIEHFPPTFLSTGTLDLFYGENLAFVKKLRDQGVEVDEHVFEGAYHAFDVLVPDAAISQKFHEICVKSMKQHFGIA